MVVSAFEMLTLLRSGPRRRDAVVFVTAFSVRALYLVALRPLFEGPYWIVAGDWLRKASTGAAGVVPTDFEPMYPAFLAVIRLLAGDHPMVAQLVQAAVAALGAVIFVRLSRAISGSDRASWVAGALYVCDPLLVKQSVAQAPFVLVAVAVVAFVHVMDEPRASLVSAAAAAVFLTGARTAAIPLVAAGALMAFRRSDRRRTAAVAAAAAASVILSAALTHAWWPTRSGWNLYLASLPAASQLAPLYDADVLEPYADAFVRRHPSASATGTDRLLTSGAVSNFLAEPRSAAVARAENLWHFFWPPLVPVLMKNENVQAVIDARGHLVSAHGGLPRPRLERLVYAPYYCIVLPAAVAGLLTRWGRSWSNGDWLLTAALGTFAVVHAVYSPGTRYRGPVAFVFVFYAAVAVDAVFATLERRWSHRSAATAA